jgi:hypothetical protein
MVSKSQKVGIAVLAIIVILAAASIYESKQVHYGDITFPGGTSNTSGGSGGKLGVGLTIEFADGTTKNIDPSQVQFTLFPLTVYLQGQAIKSVTWHAYVQLDWEGTMTSLELKGPMELKSNTGVQLRKENMLKTYTSANLPGKGAWFEMWKFSLTAEEIEYNLPQTGDYTLTCTINVTATANFSSGTQSVKTASASANMPIHIDASGITAILCNVQPQIFT